MVVAVVVGVVAWVGAVEREEEPVLWVGGGEMGGAVCEFLVGYVSVNTL
jgi:hypothetical protein